MEKTRKRRKADIDIKQCVACGCCFKVCPVGALSSYKGIYAKIDLTKCVGCGMCVKECPASVIRLKEAE